MPNIWRNSSGSLRKSGNKWIFICPSAYNIETHYPARTNLGNMTLQRNNSINDGVNTNIHSPEPVSRKGRPPYKRLRSACEMPWSWKKAVIAKHTSSRTNLSQPNTTTVSTMNYETETVRVTYRFIHLHESAVIFRVILCWYGLYRCTLLNLVDLCHSSLR